MRTALQRAGVNNGILQFHRFASEQDAHIGCQCGLFAQKKILFPDTARTGMIVVAGNNDNGNSHLTDGAAGCGYRRPVRRIGIEQITSDQNKTGLMFLYQCADSVQYIDSGLLNQRPFMRVADMGKRLAQLPVCSMNKTRHHGSLLYKLLRLRVCALDK